jgi:hypothetical protein
MEVVRFEELYSVEATGGVFHSWMNTIRGRPTALLDIDIDADREWLLYTSFPLSTRNSRISSSCDQARSL